MKICEDTLLSFEVRNKLLYEYSKVYRANDWLKE